METNTKRVIRHERACSDAESISSITDELLKGPVAIPAVDVNLNDDNVRLLRDGGGEHAGNNPLEMVELGHSRDFARVAASASPGEYIRRRAAQEWNLLCRQWRMYVTCITVNIYGGSMLFRNLAFYRYRAGERLTQDLGFDLLPEMKGYFTGFPMLILQVTCLISCAASFVPRSAQSKAPGFAINIVRRWGMMEAMGTVLRFFTYISTTLPGAADHCLPSKNPNIERDQPKTVHDIFFMIKVDGIGLEKNGGGAGTYNCGDLVFSGHMLMTISYAFVALRYAPTSLQFPKPLHRPFRVLVWVLVVVQVRLLKSPCPCCNASSLGSLVQGSGFAKMPEVTSSHLLSPPYSPLPSLLAPT